MKSILLHPMHNCCAQQLGPSAQNKLVHPPLLQPTRTHIIGQCRPGFKNSAEFAKIRRFGEFGGVQFVHIKFGTVQTKIGTFHLKFGKKSDSAMSDFFHTAEFLNTGADSMMDAPRCRIASPRTVTEGVEQRWWRRSSWPHREVLAAQRRS
jgi:hypothetical protein